MQIVSGAQKIVVGVDDNALNVRLLKEILVRAGYGFVGAVSGEGCLKALRTTRPAMILLDVVMPDIDGFETCRRLRAMPGLGKVPVAFVTSLKTRDDVLKGMAAGGNDFVLKPFAAGKLLERVGYWIARASLAAGTATGTP